MNAVSQVGVKRHWQTTVLFALGFWLSGSLILDLVIMPGLSAAGMTAQPGFAAAGYSIFGIFNRIEVLCAAIALTGLLVMKNERTSDRRGGWTIPVSVVLLGIALIYTYILTPQLSGLGLQLNLFDATSGMPAGMLQMHEGYWGLEAVKLIAGTALIGWCYRNRH